MNGGNKEIDFPFLEPGIAGSKRAHTDVHIGKAYFEGAVFLPERALEKIDHQLGVGMKIPHDKIIYEGRTIFSGVHSIGPAFINYQFSI
jgi:hypothetical protein